MISAVIIEDESLTANRLKKLIEKLRDDITVVAILQTVKESLEWLSENEEPDLYFMDIQLSDGLSFDIFPSFAITKPVIFTTAYEQYAIKAFKANGIDYLLKPISKQDLEQSLLRFKQYAVPPAVPDLAAILKTISSKQPVYKSNFLVQWKDQLLSIPATSIAFFWLANKIIYLTTTDNKVHTIATTLDLLENELDPQLFFRINRQFIVARPSIKEIHLYFGNRLKLYLHPTPQDEVVVSRERVNDFKLWLDK